MGIVYAEKDRQERREVPQHFSEDDERDEDLWLISRPHSCGREAKTKIGRI